MPDTFESILAEASARGLRLSWLRDLGPEGSMWRSEDQDDTDAKWEAGFGDSTGEGILFSAADPLTALRRALDKTKENEMFGREERKHAQ